MDSDNESQQTHRRSKKVIMDSDEENDDGAENNYDTRTSNDNDDNEEQAGSNNGSPAPVDNADNNDDDDMGGLFDEDGDEQERKGSEEEDNLFGENESDKYDEEEEEQEEQDDEFEQRVMELNLPRYPPSHRPNKDTYSVKLPDFLRVEPHPFEPSQFLKQAESRFAQDQRETAGNQAAAAERSLQFKAENAAALRWKFARDAKTGKMIKQSNARFVRWSDGSLSLQLGSEMFEVQTKINPDTFLTVSHPEQEVLQTIAMLNKSMTFVPYSTSSSTHIRLTQRLKQQQESNSATVGNVATTDDPEKLMLAALKTEEMNIKARRKLEAKKRSMEAREMYGDMGSQRRGGYSDSVAAESSEIGGGYASRFDRYEEDDGFVVPSEEEDDDDDESGAKRLKDLKRRGAEQYKKKKKRDYSDEEMEEEPEFDDMLDDDEEEEAEFTDEERRPRSKSKKRRIIADDDEDED